MTLNKPLSLLRRMVEGGAQLSHLPNERAEFPWTLFNSGILQGPSVQG